MNIYDFDNTIYDGDSCKDIVFYGLKKYPFLTLKALKKANKLNKEYKRGDIPFERVKEAMLSFIFQLDDTDAFIKSFVDKNIVKIKPWYLSKQSESDVIVSASYDLWLNEFAERLGIHYVIATRTDSEGNIVGKNCKRKEKVKRIKEAFPNAKINSAYSDSKADLPMLELATLAFVVEGNKIITYRKGYQFKNKM